MRPKLISRLLWLALSLNPTWLLAQNTRPQPTLNIALITWRGITEAEQGFQDHLKALGYLAEYEHFNAQQNKEALIVYLRGPFEQNIKQYDYVYSFGTTVSTSVFTINHQRIPHLYNIVTHPDASGLTNQNNTAGGSHGIPLLPLLTAAKKIKPFKRLGFFFNSREKNSMQILTELINISEVLHFDVIEYRSPPAKDSLKKNLAKLRKDPNPPEAFYFPNDSHIIANRALILDTCIELGLFTLSPQREYAESGAVFTLAPSFYQLGKKIAEVINLHQRGKKLIDIPVQHDDQATILISKRGLKAANLSLSEDIAKRAEWLP